MNANPGDNQPEEQPDPGTNAMTDRFREVGTRILDALLATDPEWASELGDSRFFGRLADHSPQGESHRMAVLSDALGALDAIDDTLLPVADQVDLETLRGKVSGDMWRHTELRQHTWDPMVHLPGGALYTLLTTQVWPVGERLGALADCCRLVPQHLATARGVLDDGPGMPRAHIESALTQARGTVAMLGRDVDALLEEEPSLRSEVVPARDEARAALEEHIAWLDSESRTAVASPRLGERRYAAQLWYTLDTEISPEVLLTRAQSDLIAAEEEIADVAASYDGRAPYAGQVREVLRRVSTANASAPETIRPLCEEALGHVTDRLRDTDLVSVPERPLQVIDMPEARRGVAVAYCDPPGALAPDTGAPTLLAVAPPMAGGGSSQGSFYREYNAVMLRNLMAHEALPGHALQMAHMAATSGLSRIRRALQNETFVEGWAVYAEELLASREWEGAASGDDRALRLFQLKSRIRVIINAILDVRIHAYGMTEEEAMALMTERGHQEEEEAAGKWHRAQLGSAQLSTYYVGYREVSDLARDLGNVRTTARPREIHDSLLAHGAPPPRHLRSLLRV
ncbi:uncharacterized protein (DUF885 family) [Haloactinospora alba]|uniref:Uncharacterized protein (DUF885 family) n=1 Tax=Haloactinospora alba TaxID=405555 RepID=A0A543NHJ6_9ACTN|nr:DUF885 domain-containing protein [Haloactinospora alba]TQN31234.1 uncharacterized protein (DUF885 family) [Haloactinospora alba]